MDNFSYLIYCPKSKKAALVDPGYDASKALEFISSLDLKLLYIINTHYHSDHSGDNQRVKMAHHSEIVASAADGDFVSDVDKIVSDGDVIPLGEVRLKFMITPGHTTGSLCIIVDDEALLTGDTLFIGDCGRTDLPGGNDARMYQALQEKIRPLPDHLIVYPGHDYGDKPFDTLGNQKRTNKTLLARNPEEFSRIP